MSLRDRLSIFDNAFDNLNLSLFLHMFFVIQLLDFQSVALHWKVLTRISIFAVEKFNRDGSTDHTMRDV